MQDLNRSARNMAILTVFSRASGFLRIAVFASVFGKTYLSNTYQSSNMLPNLLFELFAAGALQAALVPSMVRMQTVTSDAVAGSHDRPTVGRTGSGRERTPDELVAGAVLGLTTALLAFIGIAAAVLGPQLMGLLVGSVESSSIREAEIQLGSLWLWFFMPQMLFYGANIVATSVLNAKNSFVIPVAAPIANNVVVIGAYLLFGFLHDGPLTLDISTAETWIIAGGTTLGVVVFCAIPVGALTRSGFRLWPNARWGQPEVKRLLGEGAWAAVFLGCTQLLLFVVLRVSNRDPGGPVIYQFAFILFTLPHSLLAVPIMTTRFPSLSLAAHSGRWKTYAATLGEGMASISFLALAASAISIAVARPATALVAFGEAKAFAPEIADATIAFAPGILGFGLMLYFTRARYAVGDARSPALINAVVVAIAAVAMLTFISGLGPTRLVTGLAAAFACAQVVGAAALYWIAKRELTNHGQSLECAPPLIRNIAAAVVAAGIGFLGTEAIGSSGRGAALVGTLVGVTVAAGSFLVLQWVFGGPDPRSAVRTLGAPSVTTADTRPHEPEEQAP